MTMERNQSHRVCKGTHQVKINFNVSITAGGLAQMIMFMLSLTITFLISKMYKFVIGGKVLGSNNKTESSNTSLEYFNAQFFVKNVRIGQNLNIQNQKQNRMKILYKMNFLFQNHPT